jgi:signal transduction histidine kinase
VSIVNKILFTLLIFIFAIIAYSSFGNIFTKDVRNTINHIQSQKFPTLLIKIENIKLFEELVTIFSDAAITSELDMLEEAKQIKDKIIQNITEISQYEACDNQDLTIKEIDIYYNNSKEFIISIIKNPTNIDINKTKQLQQQKIKLLSKIKSCKDKTYNEFKQELQSIQNDTEDFFFTSQLLSIIIVLLLIILSTVLINSIQKRFESIVESISNLITDKPDFSKRIQSNSKDEIDKIIDKFNILSSKFEENYNHLEELKTISDETAKQKAQFLSTMSHEIRTPLNGIIGMTNITLNTQLDNTQKEHLTKIKNSSTLLMKIINNILDLAKLESKKIILEKIEFDITQLIEETLNLLQVQAQQKNNQLTMDIKIDIKHKYIGDSTRISQILINLIGNAIKFTQDGIIKVIISNTKNNLIQFEIKDNGIGMTKEQQSKVFEAFSQADSSTTRKYGGTGLGLTLCKEFVELMGGKILVQSKQNVGSSFIFEIKLDKSTEIINKTYDIITEINTNKKVVQTDSKNIDKSKFETIKKAVLTKRPKVCNEECAKIDKDTLNEDEQIFFEKLEELVKKYKFKEAEELL